MVQRGDDDMDSEGKGGHGGFILATQDAGISPEKKETRCYKSTKGNVAKCRQMCRCVLQTKRHYLLVHLFGRLTRTIENNKSGSGRQWTENLTATLHLQLFANNRNSCSLFVVWYV